MKHKSLIKLALTGIITKGFWQNTQRQTYTQQKKKKIEARLKFWLPLSYRKRWTDSLRFWVFLNPRFWGTFGRYIWDAFITINCSWHCTDTCHVNFINPFSAPNRMRNLGSMPAVRIRIHPYSEWQLAQRTIVVQ